MAKYRRVRINDEVRDEMAVILRTVKDPRIRDAFVSITSAGVSLDLKYARIYYSHLQGDPREVANGLKSSAGYLRTMLAKRLNLRVTPDLTFIPDDSIARGARISALINNLEFSEDDKQSNRDEASDDTTEDR